MMKKEISKMTSLITASHASATECFRAWIGRKQESSTEELEVLQNWTIFTSVFLTLKEADN